MIHIPFKTILTNFKELEWKFDIFSLLSQLLNQLIMVVSEKKYIYL